MRLDKIDVKPVQESINPELLFEIEFFIQREQEIPIEITGGLFSSENKKMANIHEFMFLLNQNFELSAENNRRSEREGKITIKLIAPLNHKTLDYIETLRQKNKKGNVDLNLDIFVKTLVSNTIISPITPIAISAGGEELKRQNQSLLAYEHSGKISQSYQNMWILSGNGSPTFIKTIDTNFKIPKSIPSSDWIHDYCPVFQIGKFSVFEYMLPDYTEGSGSVEEKLNKSINAIEKMEKNLNRGEWNGVIEDSRPFWELLRNQDELKDLLIRDGYTEPAFTDLNESIKKLFDFSSKFIHKLDKDRKNTMPDIKASKEDAYLIYALSMNVVNLISKKMQRLK